MDVKLKDHAEYTAKGYCSSIHWTGLWCVLPTSHQQDHFAVFQRADGVLEVGAQWQD